MDNTQQIIEGNKLIAESIGVQFKKDIEGIKYYSVPKDHPNSHNTSMGIFIYNSDFNSLMYAVSYIEKLGFNSEIYKTSYHGHGCIFSIDDLNDIEAKAETKKESVFNAVVLFFKWYNQNTLQK